MKNRAKCWNCVVVFLLVFFSIAVYGGTDAWFEAGIFSVIFALSAFAIWRDDFFRLADENKRLLVPLLLLATYSFLQGFSTLFIHSRSIQNPFFLPDSFDLMASFRSGFKILALVSFFCLYLISLRRNFRFSVWSLVIVGNIFALFGVARFLFQAKYPETFQFFLLPQLNPTVGFGTFLNQNHFALLMLMTLGLNISLFWFGKLDVKRRIVMLALSLISWSAIVLTASRGGIVSSFVVLSGLILFASAKYRGKFSKKRNSQKFLAIGKYLLVFAFMSLILFIGIALIGQDRVLHRFGEISVEVDQNANLQTFRRIDAWEAGVDIIRENWLYGVGFGGYQYAVSQHIDISGQIVPQQAHNDYLEFVVSGGLISIVLAVWFLYNFFSIAKERFKNPDAYFGAVSGIGAICGISGVALHSFFDFGLQFTGNLLFFIALAGILVHRSSVNKYSESNFINRNSTLLKILFSSLFLISACLSGVFSYSHFKLNQAEQFSNGKFIESELVKIPFDANYYQTIADFNLNSGNKIAAIDNLRTALFYRPEDYRLWLKLAQTEEKQNNLTAAERSFRQAIELAPLYGEPHFYFGDFLIKNERTEEGLNELAIAFHRDLRFSTQIVEIFWKETENDSAKMFKILKMNESQVFRFTRFLMEQKSFAAVVQLGCESEFPDYLKKMLVRQLLEKKQFLFAWQIDQGNCDAAKTATGNFIDGDFEKGELRKGLGFDWRIGDSLKRTNLKFDEENPISGIQSLQFILDGNYETPLISQIIPVEKNTAYQLSFSYKTSEITSGSFPVLQVILRQTDFELKAAEFELLPEKNNWTKVPIEFRTKEQTEAIEVRLTGKSCDQPICPIYGKLWIDDFLLMQMNE